MNKIGNNMIWIILGFLWIAIGGFWSSSLWSRFEALSWPVSDATVTEIIWRDRDLPVSAIATIKFSIEGDPIAYSDSVFERPWRKSNVPRVRDQLAAKYSVGSRIRVRSNGKEALLQGFPESYANWGFAKMLLGIITVILWGKPLLRRRSD